MIINKSFIRHYHNSLKKEELRLLIIFVDKDMSRIHALVTQQNGETIKADRKYIDWWSEPAYVYFTQAIIELMRRKIQMLGFDSSQSEIDNDSIIFNAEKIKNHFFDSTEPVDYETPDGEYYIEITYDEFERAIQDKIRSSIPSSCGSFDLIVLSGEKRKTPLVRKMFTEAFPDVSQEYIVCFEPEQDYAKMEQTVSLSVKTTPESASVESASVESASVDSMKSDTTSDSIEKIATSIATKTTTASAHSPSTSVSAPRPGVQSNAFYSPRTTRSQYQTRNISNLDFWDESETISVGIRADGTVAVEIDAHEWHSHLQFITGPFSEFRQKMFLRRRRRIRKEVASWENIRKIVSNYYGIFGITNENRCLFSTAKHYFGKNKLAIKRRKIVDIIAPYSDCDSVFFLFVDGTGLYMECNDLDGCWDLFEDCVIEDSLDGIRKCSAINKQLKDIRNVSLGFDFIAGIEFDGTVFAYGDDSDGLRDVQNMYGVTAIVAGSKNTYGLKRDGTVVAVGNNDKNQLRANRWTDIRSLYAIGDSVIGVRTNGKVLALGENYRGRLDVSHWERIQEIKMFRTYTLGLQEDGTLLSTDETVLKKMHDMGVI